MEPKRRWGYCFHSIIKYAEVFPDTIQHIKNTIEHIWECFLQYCWIKADAKPNDFFFLGKQCRFHVSSIVCKTWSRWTSIINISSMYCFTNIKSGLFDIREYDVTEFHRLINYRQEKKRIESHHIKESLWLQMHLQRSVSNPELVHFILDRKWLPYRIVLFIWIMVYFTFMLIYCFYDGKIASFVLHTKQRWAIAQCTILNINVPIPSNNKAKLCDIGEEFYALWVMNVVVGIPYLVFTFSCVFKLIGLCTGAFGNPSNIGLVLHNLDYIISLFITECLYIFKTH